MPRGPLPACCCRHRKVDGLQRPSGRTASPRGTTPSTITSPTPNEGSRTEISPGARTHHTRPDHHAHDPPGGTSSPPTLTPRTGTDKQHCRDHKPECWWQARAIPAPKSFATTSVPDLPRERARCRHPTAGERVVLSGQALRARPNRAAGRGNATMRCGFGRNAAAMSLRPGALSPPALPRPARRSAGGGRAAHHRRRCALRILRLARLPYNACRSESRRGATRPGRRSTPPAPRP